jgi:hypothetical protein
MKITLLLLLLCLGFDSSTRIDAANEIPANAAGTWSVTVRMPNHTVSEQWTIQQKGTVVTGVAKGEHGELAVAGTIEGSFFRVSVRDGDKQYKVRATVDGTSMDGSITLGVGESHL